MKSLVEFILEKQMSIVDHLSYYFSKKYRINSNTYPFEVNALDNVMIISVKDFDRLSKTAKGINSDQTEFIKEVYAKFKEFNEEKFHNEFLGYVALDQRDKNDVTPSIIYGKGKDMRGWLNDHKNDGHFKFID